MKETCFKANNKNNGSKLLSPPGPPLKSHSSTVQLKLCAPMWSLFVCAACTHHVHQKLYLHTVHTSRVPTWPSLVTAHVSRSLEASIRTVYLHQVHTWSSFMCAGCTHCDHHKLFLHTVHTDQVPHVTVLCVCIHTPHSLEALFCFVHSQMLDLHHPL